MFGNKELPVEDMLKTGPKKTIKDEQGKYYPDNMLNYVAIHELAHAKSKSIDTSHTGSEFKENFDNYLKRAEQFGIFDPRKGLVDNYCGVTPDTP